MDKHKKFWVSFTLVCMLLGFMLAVLYSSNEQTVQGESRGLNDLRLDLQKERERQQKLLAEIRKQNSLLEQYESSDALEQGEMPVEVLVKEKERLRNMLGLEAVTGQGFIMRLVPNLKPHSPSTHDEDTPIYDEDLRLIVNELNAYGAEAIALNGQRVIVTTAIRNVQDKIMVNNRPISPPYEFTVIGDPSLLIPALKLAGLEEYFQVINYRILFIEREEVTLPAYQGKISVKYLQPLKEDGQ